MSQKGCFSSECRHDIREIFADSLSVIGSLISCVMTFWPGLTTILARHFEDILFLFFLVWRFLSII